MIDSSCVLECIRYRDCLRLLKFLTTRCVSCTGRYAITILISQCTVALCFSMCAKLCVRYTEADSCLQAALPRAGFTFIPNAHDADGILACMRTIYGSMTSTPHDSTFLRACSCISAFQASILAFSSRLGMRSSSFRGMRLNGSCASDSRCLHAKHRTLTTASHN